MVKEILCPWSKVSQISNKCLTFGLYTQVSNSGPLGPLVEYSAYGISFKCKIFHNWSLLNIYCSYIEET